MNYTIIKISLFSLALVALSSMSALAASDDLVSRRWHLVELNGRAVPNTEAFIEISENQRRFTGNTGCNQMSGTVAIIGKRIAFSKVGTTKKFCTDRNANRQEAAFVRALESAKRFRVTADMLELMDRNLAVAKFAAARKDDDGGKMTLGTRKWVLESIANRQTFKALPRAFLNFDVKKGSVGGETSCNVFGGEFTADGRRISITDVVSTMRACIEDERMTVEREFMDGLRRADRYEVASGRLMLYDNKKLLLTFRGEKK